MVHATSQESRTALTTTSDRLSRALADLSGQESRLAEANSQYLSSKQVGAVNGGWGAAEMHASCMLTSNTHTYAPAY